MTANLYRYTFDESVPIGDIESALLLAIWGCEALHGEAQTRLDVAHYFDPTELACVIDAGTRVGRDFNRLFTGLVRREIGEDAFHVERIQAQPQEVAA